jgi:ribosome biogenesis GTPase
MSEPNVFARLQAVGLSDALARRWADRAPRAPRTWMRVTELQRESLTLHDGEREHAARAHPSLIQALLSEGDALAVGDFVVAEPNAQNEWWAWERLPPATQIARRLHDGRDKVTRAVVVANVDTAVVAMGLDGDWNPRRLERYLALVRLAGIEAVVVLTKADLCADAPRRIEAVRRDLPADVGLRALDAVRDDVPAALAPWLAPGRTLVCIGSSGVGKSTLTNALVGAAVQDTGGTRRGDQRGRHTTTARSLHVAPQGACVIDTPGLRTLRLDGEAGDIAGVFEDVAALAPQCRFRNCRHESEPGCAVRDAVPDERLASLRKLMREARRDAMTARERREQVAMWKARSQAARVNVRAKRGGDG